MRKRTIQLITDALGALALVVQTDCETDDYDAFEKAVFDKNE